MSQNEARRQDEVRPAESVSAERSEEVRRQLEEQHARIHRSAHGRYLERSTTWVTRVVLVTVAAVLAALVAIYLFVL